MTRGLVGVLAVAAGLAVMALAGQRLARPSPPPEPAAEAVGGGLAPRPVAPGDRPAVGKWRRVRPAAAVPAEAVRAVAAIPYLQGYRPAPATSGVVRHQAGRFYPGLNLYCSGHASEAVLMAADGAVRHRWRYPLRRVWPELARQPGIEKVEFWRRVRLLPDGSLLAIFDGLGLIKLDRESRLLWSYRGGIHHDLDIDQDGSIWALDRDGKLIPRVNPRQGVLEDFVTVLSPTGELRRRFSLLRAFERSAYAGLLAPMPRQGDIFHTNTIELLDGSLQDRLPAFRRGNLLVSVLQLDAIAVVDPVAERVVWALTGPWRRQHQPTVLPTGRLLLFDNLGASGSRSRLLEVDPASGAVTWRWGGDPEVDFFSKTMGSCQRLPNGNTLVVESENGRALELAPGGDTVWEFRSPHRAGPQDDLVAVLFDLVRLAPDFPFTG